MFRMSDLQSSQKEHLEQMQKEDKKRKEEKEKEKERKKGREEEEEQEEGEGEEEEPSGVVIIRKVTVSSEEIVESNKTRAAAKVTLVSGGVTQVFNVDECRKVSSRPATDKFSGNLRLELSKSEANEISERDFVHTMSEAAGQIISVCCAIAWRKVTGAEAAGATRNKQSTDA